MSDKIEPAPMTDKEQFTMGKVDEWWRGVCAHSDMDPPIDGFRACLEAAYCYMMECRAKSHMPTAPTRIQ